MKIFHRFYLDEKDAIINQPGQARQSDIRDFCAEYKARLVGHKVAANSPVYENASFTDSYYFERLETQPVQGLL